MTSNKDTRNGIAKVQKEHLILKNTNLALCIIDIILSDVIKLYSYINYARVPFAKPPLLIKIVLSIFNFRLNGYNQCYHHQ